MVYKTALVVLHYLKSKDTLECVQSVLKNNNFHAELIIVFNTKDKDLLSQINKEYPDIFCIINTDNLGFAGGINKGIKKAMEIGCENIIILNNDTKISKDFTSNIIDYANEDKSVGLVSPKIYFSPGFEFHINRYMQKDLGKVIWYAGGTIDWANIYGYHRGVDEIDKGQYEDVCDTEFATGCCMLIKRKVVEKIGFFDEKYFLYFEDVDYSVRAKLNGFKIKYCPGASLWHKNASSSGKPGSLLHVYYQTRNRLYFGYKYGPLWTKKSLILDSLKMILKGGIYQRSVTDYYFGRMGKQMI